MFHSSIVEKFKNNKFIHQQNEINKHFFNFDIRNASSSNLKKLRHLIRGGVKSILEHVVNEQYVAFFNSLQIPSVLIDSEKNILDALTTQCTIEHTLVESAINAIMTSGTMRAIRSLEQSGVKSSRHTSTESGIDRSIYFVYIYGKDNHQTPRFLDDATHIISINLHQMEQSDSLTTNRLWVGGHLNEYILEKCYKVKIGDVILQTIHHSDYTKTYQFIYPNGEILRWKINYRDEIFAGYDVTIGVALQFIYILRLLGGNANPLIAKLYKIPTQSLDFTALLQKLFSIVFPGWIYPEAKIIEELNVNQDYVHFEKRQLNKNLIDTEKYNMLENAIEKGDLPLLHALIRKKYPLNVEESENLLEVAFKIKNQSLRYEILRLLINHHVSAVKLDHSNYDKNPILMAAKEGTPEDLDLLLSSEYQDPHEKEIHYLSTTDIKREINNDFDLIEIAAKSKKYATEKLWVLQKYGADFKKHGPIYLNAAIEHAKKNNDDGPLLFLIHEAQVSPDSNELWNETPLMAACSNGNLGIVTALIQAGANVNAQLKFFMTNSFIRKTIYNDPSDGNTALHFAAKDAHLEIVKYLLQKGADANIRNSAGQLSIDLVTNNPTLKDLLATHTRADPLIQPMSAISLTKSILKRNTANYQKVAVLVTGTRASKHYVVLGKRRSNQNNYVFPGGSASIDDVTIEDAARRELFEETALDITKILPVKFTKIAQIDGFKDPQHEATTFFLVDVGEYPITTYPCDDLIDVKCVPLEQIKIDRLDSTAKYMRYQNQPILGSNALLIDFCVLHAKEKLENDEQKSLKQQLLIEEEGYYLLLNEILKNKRLKTSSASWPIICNLLDNNAHQTKHDIFHISLPIAMLQTNCLKGLDLLKKHNVDLNGLCLWEMNGKKERGTPMIYAASCNRIDIVKRLLSLGVLIDKENAQDMLMIAAKKGYRKMLFYLLNQGADPNQSYEWEGRAGTKRIYPIVSTAIKAGHIDLTKLLLIDKRIYLNRERSVSERASILMTAIKYNQKEIALLLLATFRLNLNMKGKPKKRMGKRTALVLLKDKADWQDVYEITRFLSNYIDFNEFLASHMLPPIDRFLWTKDENSLPTLHCYSNDSNKIKNFVKFTDSSLLIYNQGEIYHIRLEFNQLTKLLERTGSTHAEDIAKFLINYTQDTIFWDVRPNHFRHLHKTLITNNPQKINLGDFDLKESFNTLPRKDFYQQLIRENTNIQEIIFSYQDNPNLTAWLLKGIKHHNQTIKVKFIFDENQSTDTTSWEKIFWYVATLKKLNKITCKNVPESLLQKLLSQLEQVDFKEYPQIIIKNDRPQSKRLKHMVYEKQIKFYRSRDPVFQTTLNNILTFNDNSVSLRNPGIPAIILGKTALSKPNIKNLTIHLNFSDQKTICEFLITNTSLESIAIYSDYKSNFKRLTSLLHAIAHSPACLKFIKLLSFGFDQTCLKELISVINNHSLIILSLPYCKLLNVDRETIIDFSRAIATHPQLEILNIYSFEINEKSHEKAFSLLISKSNSLLFIYHKHKDFSPALKANLDEVIRNHTNNFSLFTNKKRTYEEVDLLQAQSKKLC